MMQLYMSGPCPFCQKVLRSAQEIGLEEGKEFTVIDASPGTQGREVVLSTGGKSMVPFLIDGDTAMYESDDIIAYMKKKSV